MKQFVVLGLGRSGSNLLVNRLNTPGSVCFGEIYHPVDIYLQFPVPGFEVAYPDGDSLLNSLRVRYDQRLMQMSTRRTMMYYALLGLPVHACSTKIKRDKDPVGYLRALHTQVVARYPAKHAWGFKLFLHHSSRILNYVCANPDYAVLILRRRNLLARYSSKKKASITGTYRIAAGGSSSGCDQPVEFDPIEFRRLIRRDDKLFSQLYKKLDKHGKTFHEIEYCELGSPEAMAGVFAHLGIEGRASEDIRVQKQGSAYDMLERFSNPEDVVRYVETNGMEAWLHEQSPRLQPA